MYTSSGICCKQLKFSPTVLFFFKAVSALLTFIQPWFTAHNLHEPPVWRKIDSSRYDWVISPCSSRVTLKHLYENDICPFCNWNKFKHSCDLLQVVITTHVFPAKCVTGLSVITRKCECSFDRKRCKLILKWLTVLVPLQPTSFTLCDTMVFREASFFEFNIKIFVYTLSTIVKTDVWSVERLWYIISLIYRLHYIQ